MLNDWSLSYGPLTIGDPETFPAVTFRNLDVMSMPEIRTNDVTLIQRDGYWAGNDYMGGRSISLSLEVHADTDDEFSSAVNMIYRAFSPAVNGESPFTFKMPGLCNGREAYVNARTRKRSNPLDASFAARYCAFEVELFATDPFVYATEETAVTLRKDVPTLVPIDGSQVAKPSIAFTTVTNPKILNAETGKSTFSVTRTGTFTVDGPNYLPGNRYLTLSESGTNANASALFTFRDMWA